MPLGTNPGTANVDFWVRVVRLMAVGVETALYFACYAAGTQLAFSSSAVMLAMLPAQLYIS